MEKISSKGPFTLLHRMEKKKLFSRVIPSVIKFSWMSFFADRDSNYTFTWLIAGGDLPESVNGDLERRTATTRIIPGRHSPPLNADIAALVRVSCNETKKTHKLKNKRKISVYNLECLGVIIVAKFQGRCSLFIMWTTQNCNSQPSLSSCRANCLWDILV